MLMLLRSLFKILSVKFVIFSKLCGGYFAFCFQYDPERKVQIETAV